MNDSRISMTSIVVDEIAWRIAHAQALFGHIESLVFDIEGLYSMKPLCVATDIADECIKLSQTPIWQAVDYFSGLGGVAASFARRMVKVIAHDICDRRLALCRMNLEALGLAHRVQLLRKDSYVEHAYEGVSVGLIDPPWGGPSVYNASRVGIAAMDRRLPGMIKTLTNIHPICVVFMPPNVCQDELRDCLGASKKYLYKVGGREICLAAIRCPASAAGGGDGTVEVGNDDPYVVREYSL